MDAVKTGVNAHEKPHVGSITTLVGFDRWFVCVAVFVVVTSVIGLVTTLAGVFHAPQVVLVSLLLTAVYGYMVRSREQRLPGAVPRWRHVLLLLLVALPLRVPVYHYVMGGQDEGLYVNIAHYIQATDGINVNDPVRQSLQGTPYLDRYDANNHLGTSYVAGVYKDGNANSHLQFQFYDLFPVWMALFIGMFGSTAGVYALTLFSLLSLVCFYRLALLLTGRHQAALIAGGLLALSPLHAFFSKFPVTEIPTLCFSLIGFLLLAAYFSAHKDERRSFWLCVSVGAFLCLFTTRISGFMYVPFMIALAWAALLMDEDVSRRRGLQFWAMAATVAYLASVLYGMRWSSHYAHDIYVGSFRPLLGEHWKAALAALSLFVLSFWLVTALWLKKHRLTQGYRRHISNLAHWAPTVIVYVALCVGLLKVYRLGWTGHYVSSHTRWHLADAGWYGASATSIWMLVVFMGPLLLLAFLISVARRTRDPRMVFLRWFAAGFFVYAVILQWIIPYSPYYTRYLLSAVVPYTVLFTVCVWSQWPRGRFRVVLSFSLIASLLYGGVLSAAQIGKNENQGARSSLARIVAHVGPDDLILLDGSPGSLINQSEVKTPLLYTFDRHVATVGLADIEDPQYLAKLGSRYDETFFLTSQSSAPPAGFEYVMSSRFKVMSYEWNHSFPHKLVVGRNSPLHLYRKMPGWISLGVRVAFASGGSGVAWLRSGWSHPEAWGTWSLGHHAVMSIGPRSIPKSPGGLILQVYAKILVNSKHPVQHVAVAVDGEPVANYVGKYPDGELKMDIPLSASVLKSKQPVKIAFSLPDAISPAAIGMNGDGRHMAIGLLEAELLSQSLTKAPNVKSASK